MIGSADNIQIYPVMDSVRATILGTRIAIHVGISNASTIPTTISEFVMDVTSKDGMHCLGYAGNDPSKFGIPNVAQQECLISQDELANSNQRLADRFREGQKAKLGKRHEGWLFFDFYIIMNNDERFDWSNNIELKVIDVFEEKHQINGGLLKKYDKIE